MLEFAQACAAWLAQRPEEACVRAAAELQTALLEHPVPVTHGDGAEPKALAWLQPLLQTPDRSALAAPLAAVAPGLNWFEPPPGELKQHLGGRNCMTQLVGPADRSTSRGIRFGTFLIAPEAYYPRHVHGAEELYVLIAGAGRWSYDGNPYETRNAGDVVRSASWQPHAIRTGDEALLMAWIWMGDISFDSYRMEADLDDAEEDPS